MSPGPRAVEVTLSSEERAELSRWVSGVVAPRFVERARIVLAFVRTVRRMRALHSWAFAQLGDFIVYKAKRAGVPLVFVDPAYTSQTCAQCGHVDKRNRVDQGLFICRGCGVVAHADRNASHNIATRGESVWNAGRESRVPATP